MNDFDDLDDLFGQLRSAATEAELAGETSHVDAMARHHRRQKGHTMFTTRRARVATFVAAGVIGFGGVAAAGSGGPFSLTGSDDTTTTSTSEVTTTTSEAPTTTSEAPTTTSEVATTISEVVLEDDAPITQRAIDETVAAAEATQDDDLDPESDEPCFGLEDPGQYDNHGEFVSSVARGDVELPEGIEQRDAAQSSCGKDAEDDDADDDADEQVEVDDEVETDDDAGDEIEADDDSDDDSDDDGGRPEQRDEPGRPESPGKSGERGNGSKKNSGD
jgi:hypothetical protein